MAKSTPELARSYLQITNSLAALARRPPAINGAPHMIAVLSVGMVQGLRLKRRVENESELVPCELREELTSAEQIARVVLGQDPEATSEQLFVDFDT